MSRHASVGVVSLIGYQLPQPLHSDADDRRLALEDLADMGLQDLATETARVGMVVCLGDLSGHRWAGPWLRERLALCQAEQRARREQRR